MSRMRSELCIASSSLFLGDGEFPPRAANAEFQLVKGHLRSSQAMQPPVELFDPRHLEAGEVIPRSSLEGTPRALETAPAAGRTCSWQHPGNGRVRSLMCTF